MQVKENVECEQLAVFVATMQLLASYSRVKCANNAVGAYHGGIKRDDLSNTEWKVLTRLP